MSHTDDVCSQCMATLPRETKAPRRTKTSAPLSARPKRIDFSDQSTDAQAPVLQQLVMAPEAPELCVIHARAKAKGVCARCRKPACEICLSHGGVCPACRREAAPSRIAELSRDIGLFTALAGLGLLGFGLWQQLDKTVLDADPRRLAIAVILTLAHLSFGLAMYSRRRFGLAVGCIGMVGLGTLLPLLGGEPWFMAIVRLGLAGFLATRTLTLKRQLDELYLALDRPE
ncbi:MAG: hypothetical protein JNM69_03110 [Archangium sp.]|nr:hypothetical protein [Archangium sp.]